MNKASRLGTRGLMALALTGGLLLMAVPGNAHEEQSPSGGDKKALAKKSLTEKLDHKGEQHSPRIHAALHELKEARHELREARHDFGGHREHALKAVDHAIHELELALQHHPDNHNTNSTNNQFGNSKNLPKKK